METAKKCRVNLSFEEIGSQDTAVNGQKPPIIFLHGMTSAKETWKNVIRPIAVATGRKAYAYDARNHGDSGWSDDFDYEVQQDDLLGFMEGVRAKKAVLVTHSMGGKTAMLFAAKMPEWVEKLVVEDMTPIPNPSPKLRVQAQKYVQLLEYVLDNIPPHIKDLGEAKDFVQEFLHKKTPEGHRSTRHGCSDGSSLPLRQDENGKFCWKTNLKVLLNNFLNQPSTSRPRGVYPGPTLILYGTKSPYNVFGDKELIQQSFPNSQFKAVEGASHQIHLEFQDVFLKEVVEFINESS